MHRHLVPKLVGAVVLLAALGGGVASAFTASNNVGPSYAGEGYNAVSGYDVTNIHYTLSQGPPAGGQVQVDNSGADISGVSFDLNNAASSVGYALFDSSNTAIGGGGGPLAPEACITNNGGYHWTCTANSNGYAPVYQVAYLDVIAAS